MEKTKQFQEFQVKNTKTRASRLFCYAFLGIFFCRVDGEKGFFWRRVLEKQVDVGLRSAAVEKAKSRGEKDEPMKTVSSAPYSKQVKGWEFVVGVSWWAASSHVYSAGKKRGGFETEAPPSTPRPLFSSLFTHPAFLYPFSTPPSSIRLFHPYCSSLVEKFLENFHPVFYNSQLIELQMIIWFGNSP